MAARYDGPAIHNAVFPRRFSARKSRPAAHATRAEANSLKNGYPEGRFSDTHVVAPLARGLYEPDGQMRDEVYNYGSFKQSKMFAAGVTCSDCHEPHAAKLRASTSGVCLQCHSPEKYAAASHSHHESANPPLDCASCHMPDRTYMVIDRRHDHSFRIPRPDLSTKVATPNACNDCHTDRTAEWAAAAIDRWHGPNRKGFQNFAEAFHAAWESQSDAGALLAHVAADQETPAFVRASALPELAPYLSAANISLARAGLSRSGSNGSHRSSRYAPGLACLANVADRRAAAF